MKKSLILASLVAASTSMMAMDLQYFLGAGAEQANANYKRTANISSVGSESTSDDISDTGLKLKAGVILNKVHRISLSHVKFTEEDTEVKVILENYDYLIPVYNGIRLYTGLHIGNASYKLTNTSFDNDTVKMSGLAYGAQVGTIYDITKNVEFELGLAYTKYNVDKTISGTISGAAYDAKIEFEHSTAMFAGLNYKF